MNTLTKLVATLPAIAILGACSTMNPTPKPTVPATTVASESVTTLAYDRMAPAPYTCTDNSRVMAKQSVNKEQVMINATVPKVNWSQQPIILNGGVNGNKASYVNESNPEVIYAWHMQGNEGILAMKWADDRTYQVDCKIGR